MSKTPEQQPKQPEPPASARTFRMAEQSADHNATLETSALKAGVEDSKRGMYFGAGLFAALIAAALAAVYITADWQASIPFLGAATIGSGIAAFVNRRRGKPS